MKFTADDFGRLKDFLRERGVRPSYIRLRILQYLLDRRTHPGAEEIYQALVHDIPTLSRASVYNTLRVFAEAGVVKVVVGTDETRYDANLEGHGHFRCKVCGKFYDFGCSLEALQYEGLEGFVVEQKELYFLGICPFCQKGGEFHGERRENAASGREVSGNGSEDYSRDEETPQ